MNEAVKNYFITLLYQALHDPKALPPCPLEDLDQWRQLHGLLKRNKLESLAFTVLQAEPKLPEKLRQILQERQLQDLILDTRQQHLMSLLRETLPEKGIPFAMVKGAYLKQDYPQSHLRFMSDIDLIIEPDSKEAAESCLQDMGGVFHGYDGNDAIFIMPGNITLETHRYLFFRRDKTGITPCSDWTYLDREKNALTEEGFALQMICHLLSNLCKAGLGIRYVMDLWVYRHRHSSQPDWDKVMAQLRQWGFGKVTENVIALSEYWFTGNDGGPFFLPELEAAVLDSSLYGISGQNAVNAMGMAGSKSATLAHHVFLSKEELQKRFPWSKKSDLLLPAAWIARTGQALFYHGSTVRSWLGKLARADKAEIDGQRAYLEKLGFFE